MADIETIRRLSRGDAGLATISVARVDGSVHSSVINAGVMDHPISGRPVVAAVLRGPSWKVRRIRETGTATALFRVGWEWASAQGVTTLIGPEDELDGFDPTAVPQLLREVFTAAGGTHDDWDEYDRVMTEDRRTAVFIEPTRVQGRG